jgi:hypothetical protein
VYEGCEFNIGDLVVYKSWYNGKDGWMSIDGMVGVVLDVIEISCNNGSFVYENDEVLYDVRVYWYTEAQDEVVPDLLLAHYNSDTRLFL